jgi:hypothetical protein
LVSNMDLSRLDKRGLVIALDVFRHVVPAALFGRGRDGIGHGLVGGLHPRQRHDGSSGSTGDCCSQHEAPAAGLALAFGHVRLLKLL